MDYAAQLNRLIWLSTTDIQARKAYAWQTAKDLDKSYPGISDALKAHMIGLAANLASESHTQTKSL